MISDHKGFAASQAYVDPAEDVVKRYMPMVRKLAWHIHGSAPSDMEPEDLIQVGLIALTECAAKHNPAEPGGFPAYAKIRVKGAMIDQLRRSAPLSRGAVQRRREIREAEKALWNRLGREPTIAELADEIGMELEEFETVRAASEPTRFESMEDAYSDSNEAFSDPTPDILAQLVTEENREALTAAIGDLPEREQLVIQLYFVDELNLSEIASILEVSVPRVHQLKAQALAKLRDILESGDGGGIT